MNDQTWLLIRYLAMIGMSCMVGGNTYKLERAMKKQNVCECIRYAALSIIWTLWLIAYAFK